MKILLDENFPLALYRRLTADGEDVEHIITLGWRGAPHRRIRERLVEKQLLFLTQDDDFLFEPTESAGLSAACDPPSSRSCHSCAMSNIEKTGIPPNLHDRLVLTYTGRLSESGSALNGTWRLTSSVLDEKGTFQANKKP